MPGLSFVCAVGANPPSGESVHEASRGSELFSDYSTSTIFAAPTAIAVTTAYPDYPCRDTGSDGNVSYFEGVLYDRPPERWLGFVHDVADAVFGDGGPALDRVADAIRGADGDYVGLVVRGKRALVFNDFLGRLPLYYRSDGTGTIITRNIDFMRAFGSIHTLDPQSVAEYLMFSYPLEERTLYPGVRRLDAGSYIDVDLGTGRSTVRQVIDYRYDHMEYTDRSQGINARNLVERFRESARKRLSAAPNVKVLSLSGGMDARNLAGAFSQLGGDFVARTFLDPMGSAQADVRISGQIASVLDIPWELVDLSSFAEPDDDLLIRMKNGLNCTSMSFILEYFSRLREQFGAGMWLFTGDGAGLFKDVLLPKRHLHDAADVVDELERFHARLTMSDAALMTRIPRKRLRDMLVSYVDGLPEETANQKYKHVIAHSYYRAWLYEGEDRNRHYFWTCSPFFDPAFYLYLKDCPDEGRYHYALYEQMTSLMTPALDVVPNADTGRVTGDPYERATATGIARRLLRPAVALKKRVKAFLHHREPLIARQSVSLAASIRRHYRSESRLLEPAVLQTWTDHDHRHELYDLYLLDTIARTTERAESAR